MEFQKKIISPIKLIQYFFNKKVTVIDKICQNIREGSQLHLI